VKKRKKKGIRNSKRSHALYQETEKHQGCTHLSAVQFKERGGPVVLDPFKKIAHVLRFDAEADGNGHRLHSKMISKYDSHAVAVLQGATRISAPQGSCTSPVRSLRLRPVLAQMTKPILNLITNTAWVCDKI
jgi:hypothetical protein